MVCSKNLEFWAEGNRANMGARRKVRNAKAETGNHSLLFSEDSRDLTARINDTNYSVDCLTERYLDCTMSHTIQAVGHHTQLDWGVTDSFSNPLLVYGVCTQWISRTMKIYQPTESSAYCSDVAKVCSLAGIALQCRKNIHDMTARLNVWHILFTWHSQIALAYLCWSRLHRWCHLSWAFSRLHNFPFVINETRTQS